MLNQYTNKDKILEAINAINAERYSSLDRSLFTKTPFQYSAVDLGQINSANEFHVYSGESWITGKHKVDLIEFNNPIFDEDGNPIQLSDPVKFNISQQFSNLNLTSGNYKIVLNFFEDMIGSYNQQLLAIDEISPDRTEIRLRAIDETNPKFLLSINQFINNVNQTSLTHDANERYLLNFSRNKTAMFVNSVVVGKYLFVKLYEPIDRTVEKNFKCWVVRENKLPYVDNVFVKEVLDALTFNVLSGTNWYASAEQNTSNATSLKSWNDLLGSSMQTSQQIVDSYFSGSLGGVKLNIDFSDFNNFIFYSSATERLENFKYKIELLEYYTAQSASAALLSGSAAITNAADYDNLYTNLIGGMDQFEQYLYYDSSSNIFTHDIPLASPIVEFVTGSYIEPSPKSNNTYPYELYSVTSSNFESWYTGVYSSASIYDTRNNNRLIRSIPEFMLLDENNEQLSTFVNMLGQHYDILYTYINAMTLINSRDEHPKKSMPNELLYSVAKQFGWNLTNGNQSKELWEYTLGTDVNGIPLTGSNSVGDPSVPSREVTYNIWRRIVNNIPGLLKAKGTKRSVQALLACYGVPQSLITIQEYGGPRINRPPTYEKLNFDYALDLIKNTSGIVRTDYNQNIGAVELRFRTDNVLKNPILPGTMNLFSAGGHDVTLEFSRGTMGRIQVNGTSSAEIEMFEGDYLTALLRTGSNNTVEVLANKSKYGKIINTVSASAIGSFSNPGTVLIGGTSGGSRLQGHVQELRIWTGSLNNAPFNNHTKAPSAYDGNIDAYQELVFRTPLTQNINHALTSSLTGVQPDVKLTISASFTGSGYPAWTNSTPYDSIEETYYFDGISLGAGTFDDNKIRLESQILTNTLNVENRASLNQFDTAPLDSNKLGVYYSPQTMINEDIIAQLGFTLLDDLIGDPTNNNRYSYPDLINTSREYWKKYADKNDMNAFLRIFSLFDLSFFKQLEQLLPARTEKILGLLIQPTIIERSKDSTLARISKLNQTHSGSIDIEKVINVTASKEDKNTSIEVIKETALSGSVKTALIELEEKTANKIEPIKEEFVQGIQENDIQNDKNPIGIINPDFIESNTIDEIGGIDIARNSVLSITGSYAAYRVIVETREDPFVGSTYSRKYLIQSGSTYIVGSTPYWESEAIVPFITASRVSEFLKINYSSSIGTTRRKAHVQDFLPTGIANHRFNGCKITSPDFNVDSKDTPDGKPVIEIAENNGNRIFTQPPGIKGNFDVRE